MFSVLQDYHTVKVRFIYRLQCAVWDCLKISVKAFPARSPARQPHGAGRQTLGVFMGTPWYIEV